MHAVTRHSSILGLVFMLLVPLGSAGSVTAVVSPAGTASRADDQSPRPHAAVGEPAPELVLPSLRQGNDPVRLSDYRGKVVYLDFWSSWCAPCRRAMPQLDALRQEYSRKDFEVVGVNVDTIAADARRFLERVPVSYPIAADPAGHTARRFGVDTLPALVVIDGRGVIRDVLRGSATEARDDLEAALVELIEQREVQ